MADITRLSRLVNGARSNINLTAHSLMMLSLKLTTDSGATNSELTKARLDNLIALQNGSDFATGTNAHTHDGRYFTESELSNATASSGSDLIGDDDTYSNFTPTAATVKGALAGIDSALAATADELVKVSANDTTAKYLEAAIVSANSILSIATLNDGGDEDLQLTVNQGNIDHGSIAGLADDDHTQYILADGTRAFSGPQSMGNNKLTSLSNGTVSGDAVNYSQLQAVQSLIENFEWQKSALDYIVDNTVAPPTEVSGDRYVLSHDGGAPNAAWDGAEAGDVVEFNGSLWIETDPSIGMFISIDDEADSLRMWSGSAWVQKYFEATTASTGLEKVGFDIRIASSAAGAGLGYSAGVLSLNVDDSTLEINADIARIKAGGILNSHINASADIDYSKLANLSAANRVLVSSASSKVDVHPSATTANLTTLVNGSDASSLHRHDKIIISKVAQETIVAGDFVNIHSNGKVQLARANAIDTSEAVIGVAITGGDLDDSIQVQIAGEVTINHTTALTVGAPIYLSSAVAGEAETAAPDDTVAGNVILEVGKASGADSVILGIKESTEIE